MKLKYLKLHTPFRSLPAKFEIIFQTDIPNNELMEEFNPYCFVGLNGSGKSNVLQVLANIFYHLECIYLNFKPQGFERSSSIPNGFDPTVSQPDAYELSYYQYVFNEITEVNITKKLGERPEIKVGEQVVESGRVRNYLPELIVGYSSGENEILSLPFFKMRFLHLDEYLDILARQYDYSSPEGRMVYIDKEYSQAILLCNLLMQNADLIKPLITAVGVQEIKSFQLTIQRNKRINLSSEVLKSINEKTKTIELLTLFEQTIEKLKKCSTCFYYDNKSQILHLDFYVNEATKTAFKQHFYNDPLELFRVFQMLFTLNLEPINRQTKTEVYHSNSLYANEIIPTTPLHQKTVRFTEFWIKKKGVNELILLKSLSDGEHQFLHSIGICLLLHKTSALFLFDEPETHFNPSWRAKFISILKAGLQSEKSSNKLISQELLITSHSPFIISDCKPNKVFIFSKKENNGTVSTAEKRRFNTFGTSINIITEEIFDKDESIGDLSLELINELKNRVYTTLEDIQQAKEDSRLVGESPEKTLLFMKLLQLEEKVKTNND